jgi:choline transport protein
MTVKTWEIFIIYQGLNLATASVVLFGNKIIRWLVVLTTVVACAPTYQSSEFVFRTWINNTGWENNVVAFAVGLVNPLYSLGGLDGGE